MYHFTRPSSPLDRILVPRLVRMYLALWLIRRWRLPATPAFTLPVAVKLKRFLAPDLVFILGILRVLVVYSDGLRPIAFKNRHGMPFGRAVRRSRLYRGKAGPWQGARPPPPGAFCR